MFLVLIIVCIVALLSDFYIWYYFIHNTASVLVSTLYWLPTTVFILIVLMALIGYQSQTGFQVLIGILLVFGIPKLLFTLFSILGKGTGLIAPVTTGLLHMVGASVAIVVALGAIYGMTLGWKKLVVREVPLSFRQLPKSFEGYRIAQISDLHLGTFRNDTMHVHRIVKRINDLRPDLIVFTGDLVNSSADEILPYTHALSLLKAPDGVMSVMGNHDYCIYNGHITPEEMAQHVQRLQASERSFGWQLLNDEHRTLRRGEDSIVIAGVQNIGLPPFPSAGDLKKALQGVNDSTFTILLSHDPTHWHADVLPHSSVNLTLSGHTHAMQFRIGNFSPSQWVYKEWGGLYHEAERTLHVSTGTGANIAFRFGAWPEITLITLRQSAEHP